jgi:hypothetical protein
VTTRIAKARLAAAHEGEAELIVTIRYDNGGKTDVPLDRHASNALLTACAAEGLEDLVGQDWRHVRDALKQSFNRFLTATPE